MHCFHSPQAHRSLAMVSCAYGLQKSLSFDSDLLGVSSWEEASLGTPQDALVETSCIFSWNREIDQLDFYVLSVEKEARRIRQQVANRERESHSPESPLTPAEHQRGLYVEAPVDAAARLAVSPIERQKKRKLAALTNGGAKQRAHRSHCMTCNAPPSPNLVSTAASSPAASPYALSM
ncbi:hypothetical protein cyc_01082 [Cyclospora cayetanensis]|uniref:Uncharacterized protein n=1 Tax=Cyclospora cayetanensis TaxID=88456 RepID=A0A1D3D3A6_9EIME|nr:hypothetical protein cyc_01082 [Cyclospora cayetanensis]